jgi:NAD(P)-dependent dehydrogenase (short-subunit alcohol dehydrogenase family)
MQVLDRFRLDRKVTIVTGASAGLGLAIAQARGAAGADVAPRALRAGRHRSARGLPAYGSGVRAAGYVGE